MQIERQQNNALLPLAVFRVYSWVFKYTLKYLYELHYEREHYIKSLVEVLRVP
jgi:hypothetical protein